MDHSSDHSFEPWMLTAYALNELDDAQRVLVEERLAIDPQLRLELEAIRSMAQRVEQEFAISQASIPLRNGVVPIGAAGGISVMDALGPYAPSVGSDAKVLESVDALRSLRRRRFVAILATGLAAGLAGVSFWLVQPVREEVRGVAFGESSKVDFAKEQASPPADKVVKSIPQAMMPEDKKESLESVQEFVTGKAAPGGMDGTDAFGALADAEGMDWKSSESGRRRSEIQGQVSEASADAKGFGGGQAPAGWDRLSQGRTRERFFEGQSGRGLARSAEEAEVTELRRGAIESKVQSKEQSKGALDQGRIPDELLPNVPRFRQPASGDRFESIAESPFVDVKSEPLSTFSIDVDTASYSKLRQYVLEQNVLPPASSVRIEEWLNYFDYSYPGPEGDEPFAAHLRMGDCPWNERHRLVRVAIQAKRVESQERPASNLVFLIDVSGSMADANKLPLVKRTLTLLANQLREQDRVAIVVYAGAAGCVLPSTNGLKKEEILSAIDELQSGGSTNGGQGIELAYRLAKESYIEGGVNRVILCTDGDFNVGTTSNDALVALVREQSKNNVFLTCLGYGSGNYNDSMMERITNEGNGTYGMIDSELEARRVMGAQLNGNLMTIAKDVKIQVEFNPQKVQSYRLIGYENRRLAAEDFNNDKKDAGEIGAGHRVTALYEVVPVGVAGSKLGDVDGLRYAIKPQESKLKQTEELRRDESDREPSDEGLSKEWLLLKIRSKRPEGTESTKQEFVLEDSQVGGLQSGDADVRDFLWASSVAEFGLLMRGSALAPGMDWERMLSRAYESSGEDPLRRECVVLMRRARALMRR